MLRVLYLKKKSKSSDLWSQRLVNIDGNNYSLNHYGNIWFLGRHKFLLWDLQNIFALLYNSVYIQIEQPCLGWLSTLKSNDQNGLCGFGKATAWNNIKWISELGKWVILFLILFLRQLFDI